MKKVLVTGSNGFIGKHLVSKFQNHNDISLILSSRKYLKSLEGFADQFIVDSYNFSVDWSKALKDVDSVIHLAWVAHKYETKDKASFKVHLENTINLANQSVKAGVKRFIFLSSVKVNGEKTLDGRSFSAEDNPNPQSSYGKSKLQAEKALKKISKKSGLELVVIRPVLVYGPGVKGNLLILITWIKKGIPLPFGSVKNRRSLVSINNLVDFIITCLKHPSAANQTFLVSDKLPLSTKTLITKIGEFLNKKTYLISFPSKILNFLLILFGREELINKLTASLEVDIKKNLDLLKWEPPQTVEDALLEMSEYFRENEE